MHIFISECFIIKKYVNGDYDCNKYDCGFCYYSVNRIQTVKGVYMRLLFLKRVIYMHINEEEHRRKKRVQYMMGLYNILKVYYAIEQTMESCVPLGVTDFVRTSSQVDSGRCHMHFLLFFLA